MAVILAMKNASLRTKGQDQSPVFAFLTAKHSKPRWNFYKYLVGRDGRVLDHFVSFTRPGSPRLRKAIEKALAQKIGVGGGSAA